MATQFPDNSTESDPWKKELKKMDNTEIAELDLLRTPFIKGTTIEIAGVGQKRLVSQYGNIAVAVAMAYHILTGADFPLNTRRFADRIIVLEYDKTQKFLKVRIAG